MRTLHSMQSSVYRLNYITAASVPISPFSHSDRLGRWNTSLIANAHDVNTLGYFMKDGKYKSFCEVVVYVSSIFYLLVVVKAWTEICGLMIEVACFHLILL